MLTLAIDTAANFCSACIRDDGPDGVRAAVERDIGRGHAEMLTDVVAEALSQAGAGFGDLGSVAAVVGPGSFTGIRVGVAAARGFGLALDVPVVGITTLEALAADAVAAGETSAAVTVAVRGGRGEVFMQSFDRSGMAAGDPFAVAESDAAAAVPNDTGLLAGNAAAALSAELAAAGTALPVVLDRATGAIATVARLAAGSRRTPSPLYLRSADAKPQTGFALPRRDSETAELAP